MFGPTTEEEGGANGVVSVGQGTGDPSFAGSPAIDSEKRDSIVKRAWDTSADHNVSLKNDKADCEARVEGERFFLGILPELERHIDEWYSLLPRSHFHLVPAAFHCCSTSQYRGKL